MAGVKITTPFATPEQVAEILGVSKTRMRRLVRLAAEASAEAESVNVNQVGTHAKSSPRKAAKKKS